MRIGLDFGGVIANHHALKVAEARALFPRLAIRGEADVLRAVLLPKVGEAAYAELLSRIQERTLEIPLYADAPDSMERLVGRGHQFFVVTTQATVPREVIAAYLAQHALPIEGLSVVRSDEGKYEACREFRVEAFLDDNLSVLEMLRPLGIPLFLANFHRAEIAAPFARPVASWAEFARILSQPSARPPGAVDKSAGRGRNHPRY